MTSSNRGFALVDVVFACGLVAIIAGIAIPAMKVTRDRDAARLAGRYLATRFQAARLDALRRNTSVAIRFDPTQPGLMNTYVDGDGDGVLQRDVDAGTDYPLGAGTRVADVFDSVAFRIAADTPDPDGTATLVAGSDPVRLGSSNFLTFSPLGGSTSGTIYLAARTGSQVCVRVLGATGRLRVLWYDTVGRTWRQD